jgi:hypothetical protein
MVIFERFYCKFMEVERPNLLQPPYVFFGDYYVHSINLPKSISAWHYSPRLAARAGILAACKMWKNKYFLENKF